MRIVFLTFLIFICGVFLLSPHLSLSFMDKLIIPPEYYLYATLGILFLTILLQIETMSFFRFKARQIEVNREQEKLSEEKEEQHLLLKELSAQKKSLEKNLQETKDELDKIKLAFQNEVKQNKRLKESLQHQAKHDVEYKNILTLISLLQEKGRFIDFVMEDMTAFTDEQVGTAARFVHQGCKKVLDEYFDIIPVCEKNEGEAVDIQDPGSSKAYRMLGSADASLLKGTLVHRGWQTNKVDLPKLTGTWSKQDLAILAPAEIDRLN